MSRISKYALQLHWVLENKIETAGRRKIGPTCRSLQCRKAENVEFMVASRDIELDAHFVVPPHEFLPVLVMYGRAIFEHNKLCY